MSGPEEAEQEWVDVHPIGCIGEPNDIAYGVLYLASDESKFVTGAELIIDGGLPGSVNPFSPTNRRGQPA